MMILSGSQIHTEVERGAICIKPFYERFINPNSYNYHLSDSLKIAPFDIADPKKEKIWESVTIPETGYLLEPSRFYLGTTLERIGSSQFVTSLIGRSSLGRLGLFLQLSADLAQLGAAHCWTLELYTVQPLIVYPGMEIGQVSFWVPYGEISLYTGVYGTVSEPYESQPGGE